MKIGSWARFLLAVAPLLAGCGDFWQAPTGGSGTGSFSLTNNGPITVTPGATSGNTATITVTPSSSFTGTVTLACALTSSPSNATSPASCSLSSSSLDFTSSSTEAQTATMTATTTASTTAGGYQFTVTGSSSGVSSETTSVCVEVTSGTCSSATGTSGYFFVLNQGTNEIVSMQLSSGQVSGISNGLLVAATPTVEPAAIAVGTPNGNNGNFLYVSTEGGIYLYTIASNGALTVGNSGQPIAPIPYIANSMRVDSTNSWLVFTISGLSQLYALAINSSTGLPTVLGEQPVTLPLPTNATPLQLVISPNDSSSCTNCYVFVAMGNAGTETVLFNPASANPFVGSGNISVLNNQTDRADNTVAVDPQNRLLYVGETGDGSGTQTGGLRAFTFTGTGTSEISGFQSGNGTLLHPAFGGRQLRLCGQSICQRQHHRQHRQLLRLNWFAHLYRHGDRRSHWPNALGRGLQRWLPDGCGLCRKS